MELVRKMSTTPWLEGDQVLPQPDTIEVQREDNSSVALGERSEPCVRLGWGVVVGWKIRGMG